MSAKNPSPAVRSSVSLPQHLLDDLTVVADHLCVSRSAVMVCVLRPTIRDLADLIEYNPPELEHLAGTGLIRLRGDSEHTIQERINALFELLDLRKRGQY